MIIHQKTYQTLSLYLLVIVVFLVYMTTLTAEALTWNDDALISSLHAIQKGNGSIWNNSTVRPIPLALFSYFQSFGDGSLFLFHLVNIAAHAANVLLFFFLLIRFQQSFSLAFITSAVFGLHPMHSGTISWISQFPVIFSLTILLLLAHVYIFYCRSNKRRYLLFTGILAVMFHSVVQGGIQVLIILITIDLVERGNLTKRNVIQKIPFLLFCVASALMIKESIMNLYFDSVQCIRFGIVEGLICFLTITEQIGIVPLQDVINGNIILEYSMYPLLVPFIIFGVMWYGKNQKILTLSFFAFLVFSLPIFSWSEGGGWILNSERYYISSFFLVFPVIFYLKQFFEKIPNRSVLRRMAIPVVTMVLCFLAFQTYRSSQLRQSNISFWTYLTNEYPQNSFVLNKIGSYHFSKYEIPQAISYFSESIQYHPQHYESFNNRGLAYLSIYQMDSAKADFEHSIEIFPQYALAYYNLSTVYSLQSDWDSAIKNCTKAIEIQPDFVQAFNNRGNTFARQKKYVQAFADYETAARIDPKYPDIYGNRALIFLESGNATNAVHDFQKQADLTLTRFDVFIHLGLTYIMTADTVNSIIALSNAVKLDSANAKLYLSAIQSTFLKDSEDRLLLNHVLRKIDPHQRY